MAVRAAMPTLTIRLAKKPDGTSVLACTRPDGSQTRQRHRHAFFPLHDLAHYAAETTLELNRGFYGLLAEGWNVTDFGTRPLPDDAAEAALAEAIAGLLDGERATGTAPKADDFNAMLKAVLEQMGHAHDRLITAEELRAIRHRLAALSGRWTQLEAGGEMELAFAATPARQKSGTAGNAPFEN